MDGHLKSHHAFRKTFQEPFRSAMQQASKLACLLTTLLGSARWEELLHAFAGGSGFREGFIGDPGRSKREFRKVSSGDQEDSSSEYRDE
jgi:hypothetical protein